MIWTELINPLLSNDIIQIQQKDIVFSHSTFFFVVFLPIMFHYRTNWLAGLRNLFYVVSIVLRFWSQFKSPSPFLYSKSWFKLNYFKLECSLEMYVDYSNDVETNQYNWIWRMKRKLHWIIVVFSLKYEWKTQNINFKD